MNSYLDDDTLMARTAGGEEAAFRLLVLRWEGQVKAFLIHMLGSVEEAEDLAQDTFVQVFRKAGSYRPEGKFQSWLFRVAGNRARSRLRRKKILGWVRFNPDLHDRRGGGNRPDEDLEQAQLSRAIQTALDRLPARQRQALALCLVCAVNVRQACAGARQQGDQLGRVHRTAAAKTDHTVDGFRQRYLQGLLDNRFGRICDDIGKRQKG